MTGSQFAFVDVVAAGRDLVVTSSHERACRLEPRDSDLDWFCDLDDGTPTGESDPASFVRWVCPSVRGGRLSSGTEVSMLDVRRAGTQSDVGRVVKKLGLLAGRASGRPSSADDAATVRDVNRRHSEVVQ